MKLEKSKLLKDTDIVSLELIGNEIVKNLVGGNITVPTAEPIKKRSRICRDTTTRGEDTKNFERSKRNLQKLIKCHTEGILEHIIFITLTYAKKKNDLNEINKDINDFMERMRYHYAPIFGQLSFIAVPEPYAKLDGYHIHFMLLAKRNRQKRLYIDWKEVRKVWGFGDVDVSAPQDEDSMGRYLVPNHNLTMGAYCEKMNKKAALQEKMPKYSKLYWKSRDLKLPTAVRKTNAEADKIISSFETELVAREQFAVENINEETGEIFTRWYVQERYQIKNYKANHKDSITDKEFVEYCNSFSKNSETTEILAKIKQKIGQTTPPLRHLKYKSGGKKMRTYKRKRTYYFDEHSLFMAMLYSEKSEFYDAYLMLAWTGMRISELVALEWLDFFDYKTRFTKNAIRCVRVNKYAKFSKNKVEIVYYDKYDYRNRFIPIPRYTSAFETRANKKRFEILNPSPNQNRQYLKYVFTDKNGNLYQPSLLNKQFKKMCKPWHIRQPLPTLSALRYTTLEFFIPKFFHKTYDYNYFFYIHLPKWRDEKYDEDKKNNELLAMLYSKFVESLNESIKYDMELKCY